MKYLKKMQFLWTAAHEVLECNPALSSFYLSQIQSDKNVSISKTLLRRFCTHCSTLFIPGVTCKVEIKSIKAKKNNKKSSKDSTTKIKRKDNENTNKPDYMEEDEQQPNYNISSPEKLYYSLDEKNDIFQSYKYSNIVKYTCNLCHMVTIFNGTSNSYKLEKPSLETIDEEMEINLPNKNVNNNNNKRTSSEVINSPIPNHYRSNSNSSVSSSQANNQNKNKKRKRNKNDLQQLLSKSNENKRQKTYSLNDFLSNL